MRTRKQDHYYVRDARIPEWHGWHAGRRGLGSNLYRLGVMPKVIQQILRHSNVSVTENYYILSTPSDVVAAMEKFEQKITSQSLQDSYGTLKPDSGAMLKIVN